MFGGLIAFVCVGMPESLRQSLYPSLKSLFDGLESLRWIDTKACRLEGHPDPFECIHWCWWARYCVQVCYFSFLS